MSTDNRKPVEPNPRETFTPPPAPGQPVTKSIPVPNYSPPSIDVPEAEPTPELQGLSDLEERYIRVRTETKAAVDILLLPTNERALLDNGVKGAILSLEFQAVKALAEREKSHVD